MNERLSEELVKNLAYWAADAKPTTAEVEALAREVLDLRHDNAILKSAAGEEGRANRMTYMYERAQEKLDAINALDDYDGTTHWGDGYAFAMRQVKAISKPRPGQ